MSLPESYLARLSMGYTVGQIAREFGVHHREVLKSIPRVSAAGRAKTGVNDGTTIVNNSPRGKIDDSQIDRKLAADLKEAWED